MEMGSKACLDKYDYIVDVNIPININCAVVFSIQLRLWGFVCRSVEINPR